MITSECKSKYIFSNISFIVVQEYQALCEELRRATADLELNGNIQAIMPSITKFETSGFPDNDGAQKAALAAVANIVDSQFKKVNYWRFNGKN